MPDSDGAEEHTDALNLCPTCQRPLTVPKPHLEPFTPNEIDVLDRLRTGQDKVTDGITSFAGSTGYHVVLPTPTCH